MAFPYYEAGCCPQGGAGFRFHSPGENYRGAGYRPHPPGDYQDGAGRRQHPTEETHFGAGRLQHPTGGRVEQTNDYGGFQTASNHMFP